MSNKTIHLPVVAPASFGGTLRTDNWWAGPALTFFVLSSFVAYATWRTFEGAFFDVGPYLSPVLLAALRRRVGAQGWGSGSSPRRC